jgi:hypothetical protein
MSKWTALPPGASTPLSSNHCDTREVAERSVAHVASGGCCYKAGRLHTAVVSRTSTGPLGNEQRAL